MVKKTLTIVFILACAHVQARGWPKEQGKGYYKIGYSWINGSHFFDNKGNKVGLFPGLNFSTISFYGEYGVTDRLTAVLYFPFATTAKLEDVSGSITTLGDTNVGLRYGLITGKPNVLSATLTLGIPLGRATDFDATPVNNSGGGESSLQTGDGEFNPFIKLESGHSFKDGFYASSFATFAPVDFQKRSGLVVKSGTLENN